MPAQTHESNISDLNIQPLKESDPQTAPEVLASRLDDDGYVVFRNVLDLDKVAAYRRDMVRTLSKHGVVEEVDGDPIYTGRRIEDRDTVHDIRTSIGDIPIVASVGRLPGVDGPTRTSCRPAGRATGSEEPAVPDPSRRIPDHPDAQRHLLLSRASHPCSQPGFR